MLHLTDRIGNTPLLYLESISRIVEANIYLKYEACNPFGSAQDRVAWGLIQKGLESGEFKAGGSVVGASSGNFALSLARLCGSMQSTLYITMPAPKDKTIYNMLLQLGVEVRLTPAEEGMAGAQKLAEFLHADTWGSFFPDQFYDDEAVQIHYRGTGSEIAEQCKEADIVPDLFISGIGTGATITGVGKRLKEINKNINIVGVEPAESPVLSGGKINNAHALTGIGAGFVPEILDKNILSTTVPVCFEDAKKASRRLLTKEGLSCGLTTGANLYAALVMGRRPEYQGKNIIIMGHDALERHLGELTSDQ